jgi:hypothetical protein
MIYDKYRGKNTGPQCVNLELDSKLKEGLLTPQSQEPAHYEMFMASDLYGFFVT